MKVRQPPSEKKWVFLNEEDKLPGFFLKELLSPFGNVSDVPEEEIALIHHQDVICGVAFDHSSLRRKVHTPQSSLLSALHLTPSWRPG